MIGWRSNVPEDEEIEPRGFDDFDLLLGDVMRGERATMGKSLLDVQRELKIKATYIAAIENADISAFETPGFIAGYVRSYSRYLGLDPEWAFETFCDEAGFAPASGLDKASDPVVRPKDKGPVFRRTATGIVADGDRDPIAQPRVSYVPASASPLAALEPRAIGSTLVLLALIGAIGYGGWSVLQEVQRVTVAPVERAPEAVAQVDPLAGVVVAAPGGTDDVAPRAAPDALERLYRPEALDTPVMVARDGPIAAINPEEMGILAGPLYRDPGDPRTLFGTAPTLTASTAPQEQEGPTRPFGPYRDVAAFDPVTGAVQQARAGDGQPGGPVGNLQTPRVTADVPEVVLVAVQETWVRVRAADGSTLISRVLQPGETWEAPPTEAPLSLRTGNAGAMFFAVNGQTYGPAGGIGAVVGQIALAPATLTGEFALVDPASSSTAREAVRVAQAALTPEPAVNDAAPEAVDSPAQ